MLIVADASDPFAPDHIRVVDEILNDLGASGKPSIVVWNKWDKVAEDFRTPFFRDAREEMNVSALTGMGLDELKAAIKQRLETKTEDVKLSIPFSEGWVLPYLYENGSVKVVAYSENNAMVEVEIDRKCMNRIRPFIIQSYSIERAVLKDGSVNEIYGYDPSCKL